MGSVFLALAGILNFTAAGLHIAIIFVGPKWYRLFGAGEAMATAAERGSLRPAVITLLIATVLTSWGLYAWSGAGIIAELPLLKPVLVLITAIYFIRGLVGHFAPFVSDHPYIKENSTLFWMVSSTICIIIAIVHLIGLLALNFAGV